ncbi:MAG TPA: site-2 protease family protein [Sedimentisphaerales bacterium]|nr:site-2 protease family protein [Sedimentisphaerales bacterium]
MSKTEGTLKPKPQREERDYGVQKKSYLSFLWIAVAAVALYLIVRNISAFGNILLVALGFGAVVLVHEFGHFIVAKLSGVKVEAFSIGFPPTLAGILRTEEGCRISILPRFFPKKDGSDESRLSFTVGKKGRAGETEYRIGAIPFGGFVKMLGQEDVGSVKTSDDPRSYANKPISTRVAIIATGVVFNAISAMLLFMMVFLIGIELPPAVVGSVVPDSPAARAGLKPGDEIIEIAGKSENLDFSNIQIAAALSDVNEAVNMKVRHEDGSEEEFAIVAEQFEGNSMRLFGVWPAQSLTIAEVSDTDIKKLNEKTGLLPGDRITSVNGRDVKTHWHLETMVQNSLVPTATVVAERTTETGEVELVESQIPLSLAPAVRQVESESDLSHIYSIVPRLRIEVVDAESGLQEGDIDAESGLQEGDIVLAIGDVENPTYKEMREVTTEYEKRELPIKVLRTDATGAEEVLVVTVVPKRRPGGERVLIGIIPVLDAGHPVVAKTIAVEDGPERLEIPRGAVITAVDGTRVSSFYDIIREIGRYPGQRVVIDYRINDQVAGNVALNVDARVEFVTVESTFAEFVPFDDLRRLYKAGNPIDAVGMGYKKTVMFITQTYLTLRRLVGRDVSPKSLIGPVGILAASYTIVSERPFVYYFYFLGLISACIAVVNFLPLPPLDGGVVVLLFVEKVKGSALSERTQGVIAYAGWVLIGGFFLYITFNDIVRSFFS